MSPPYQINYSLFSNRTYRERQIINPVNGLVDVPTNETKPAPPQSVCDQSTIALLEILHDDAEFAIMNAPLPQLFNVSPSVRAANCNSSKEYGLKLLRAVSEYQKNCWSYCFEAGVAGYRKRLDSPYDQELDNNDDGNSSNVLIRLLGCDSASWFDKNVSDVVYDVIQMCSLSPWCTSLCSGIINETEAVQYQQYFQSVLVFANNLTEDQRQSIITPSVMEDVVLPIAQTASLFGQVITENAAGSAVAQYIDWLANPKTGLCPVYDQAMAALLQATGGKLSPFWEYAPSDSIPAVQAVRSPAYAACQVAIQDLYAACARKDTADLCSRASDPAVVTIGAFDTCDDSGLAIYRSAAINFNNRCGPLGFERKPTLGPVGQYILSWPRGRIDMTDCFPDHRPYIAAFFGIFTVVWILIALLLNRARQQGHVWLSSCDITLDISISRTFTVTGTLWLLYFFYRFTTDFLKTLQLNYCSEPWPECGGFYFPFVLYLFVVCLMWVAAFSWVFVGNNPYRRHGALWSLGGVGLSHFFTFVMSRQCLEDLDLGGNTFPLRCQKLFEASH